jgi:hypothetical protein
VDRCIGLLISNIAGYGNKKENNTTSKFGGGSLIKLYYGTFRMFRFDIFR